MLQAIDFTANFILVRFLLKTKRLGNGDIDMYVRPLVRSAAGWLLGAIMLCSWHAAAGTATVNATDTVYAAGSQGAGGANPGGTGHTVPNAVISLDEGTTSLTFSSVTGSNTANCRSSEGCISLNGGGNYNDPDGNDAAVSASSETGFGSISGITAPGAGYLVGVFLGPGGPSGPAPSALDFASSGTLFTSLSPLINQVFFIGDGLTGDGTGARQTFYVPSGASQLVLGISDACADTGGPGCYNDNLGTYTVTYDMTAPDPASLTLLGAGIMALGLRTRRKSG